MEITYDPRIVDYQTLLDTYWKQIDPTDPGGQFVDRGPQYRSVIFTHTDEQMSLALESRSLLTDAMIFDAPIVTEILVCTNFLSGRELSSRLLQNQRTSVQILPIPLGPGSVFRTRLGKPA